MEWTTSIKRAPCASALLACLLCDSALSGSLRTVNYIAGSKSEAAKQNKSTAPATQTCVPFPTKCFFVSLPRPVAHPYMRFTTFESYIATPCKTHVHPQSSRSVEPHSCLQPRACRYGSRQFLSSGTRSALCNATTARHLGVDRCWRRVPSRSETLGPVPRGAILPSESSDVASLAPATEER